MRDSGGYILARPAVAGGGGSDGRAQAFIVMAVDADTLTCRTWDGSVQGIEDVLVAKPPLLRQAVIDGQSRDGVAITWVNATTATATDGSDTETWKITLSYEPGDIIYAVRAPTGVSAASWQDLNVDGRTWARVEAS